jgi:hypothetical protein
MLPPLYQRWIDELLAAPLPAETEATCDDCAMCAPPAPGVMTFDARTKCCTYTPALPNFLVGRVLDDDDPALARGRASVEERLRRRVAVTPLGLGRSVSEMLLYERGGERTFGRSPALRCPHYLEAEGGLCGVWRHRNAVCATWFCKHERGAVGEALWRAVEHLLGSVERALARWCLVQLDVEPDVLRRLSPGREAFEPRHPLEAGELDATVDEADYAARWGAWAGREAELYRACARLVAPLGWDDVRAIAGAEALMHARVLRAAHAEHASEALPARLRVGPIALLGLDADAACVGAYRVYDPLLLPPRLLDLLRYFDGGPTDEALRRMAEAEGTTLDASLVRRLVDFGVLVSSA